MPIPTPREVFGPLEPIPLDKLVDESTVRRMLNSPGTPFEVEERLVDGRLQTVYKDLPKTVGEFWKINAETWAKRDYIVYEDERFTYEQMWHETQQVASWLRKVFQIRKGDRVGIAARNYPEFVSSFWAISMLGGVAVLLNSFNDGDLLAFSINDVACRIVICDGERYERLHEYLPTLTAPRTQSSPTASSDILSSASIPLAALVVMPRMGTKRLSKPSEKPWLSSSSSSSSSDQKGKTNAVYDWEELMTSAKADKMPTLLEKIEPEDPATILFTSGTSGKPKGVLSTQRQSLSSLRTGSFNTYRLILRRKRPIPPPPDPSSLEQSTGLILIPLMHTTGLNSGLFIGTAGGTRMVLMPAYRRDDAVAVVKREQVRTILGISFMVREIALCGENLPSITSWSHGGASPMAELPGETRKAFPETIMSQGYGLTEVNGAAINNGLDDYLAKPKSTGLPANGIEAIIVDPETGVKMTASGETGELWLRSPARALGYVNRPKETAEAFLPDGWFRTGDLANRDEDGYFYIVDRMKDMIIRGGENISCKAVEDAVYSQSTILHCTAVGVPDERYGERVGVVCVPKEGVDQLPSEGEIRDAAKQKLPKHAVPEFVWVRKEPMPRNLSGKVLRKDVKQALLDYLSKSQKSPKSKL